MKKNSSAEPQDSELAVCMVPADPANPYQACLSQALGRIGAAVELRRHLKGLVGQVLRRVSRVKIVHVHWLPSYPATLTGWMRALLYLGRLGVLRLLGRPMVWTVHNLRSHEEKSQAVERFITRRVAAMSDRILVHSPRAVDLLVKGHGSVSAEKVAVVPHGNYLGYYRNEIGREDARRTLGLDPDALGFLFLGNIRPYKGVPELLEAFRGLPDPGNFLLVAGRPMTPEYGEGICAEAAGDDRIRVDCRRIEDDELQIYLNASEVVVFPYSQILTSGAVVLAMSFGKACIAPRLGCIPDVLGPEGAFLYDPDDRGGLAAALRQAREQRGRLGEMGAHNLKKAREWGWDRIARETMDHYRAVLQG